MTVTVNSFPDQHFTLYWDPAAQSKPEQMTWFMNGVSTTVFRNAGEDVITFWCRVQRSITEERERLQRTRSLLDYLAHCHVYAGELTPDSLAKIKKQHMRQHILSSLLREGGAPASTGATGGSRTRSLLLLGKMTGTTRPRKKVMRPEHLQ